MDLFDKDGRSAVWLEGQIIFDARGRAVGFLQGEEVRSYATGQVIGWWAGGWLRDLAGRCLGFADLAGEGPERPSAVSVTPRRVSQLLPPRPKPRGLATRPPFQPVWSELSIESWMDQGRG